LAQSRGRGVSGENSSWSSFDMVGASTKRLFHSLRLQPRASLSLSSWDKLKWSKKSLLITQLNNFSNDAKPKTTIEISTGGGLLADEVRVVYS